MHAHIVVCGYVSNHLARDSTLGFPLLLERNGPSSYPSSWKMYTVPLAILFHLLLICNIKVDAFSECEKSIDTESGFSFQVPSLLFLL